MSIRFRSSWALMTLTLGTGLAACTQTTEPPAPDEAEDVQEARQALTTCVTIQRGATGNVYDTCLLGDYPSTTSGNDYSFYTGASSGGNRNIGLLKADLSPIPQGATLVSATLNVKASWSADNSNVNVYPVLSAWDEATTNGSNFNAATGISQTAAGSFAAGDGGVKSVDVTGLVGQWLSGALANNGVALNDAGGSSHLFWTSECSAGSQPNLTVCYNPPVVNPQPQPPSAWSRSPSVGAVGTDPAGNTVGTGSFSGTANFGTGAVTSVSSTSDLYVVRYDINGVPLWTKRFGDEAILNNEGPRDQYGSAVATDKAGNVFTTGTFKGQLIDLQSTGVSYKPDVFVIKLDKDGNALWTRKHTLFNYVTSPMMQVDSQGRPVVMAGCQGPVDGVFCANGSFLVKDGADGAKLWQTMCQGNSGGSSGYFTAFSMDGNDNTISAAAIYQSSTSTINCGSGNSIIQSTADVVLVKHDTNGNLVWMKQFPTGGAGLEDVAADPSGNIYAAVALFGTGTFGVTVLQPGNYLLKFDSNGTLQSSMPLPATVRHLATDPSGNVVVVGQFNGTVNFGFGGTTAVGQTDNFVWKLSPSYTPLKLLTIGTPNSYTYSARIAIDGFGKWSLSGELNGGSYDFGQGPLSGSFLAKIVN